VLVDAETIAQAVQPQFGFRNPVLPHCLIKRRRVAAYYWRPKDLDSLGALDKPYDPLLGRKTYDIFASYWPYVPADDPIGPVFTKANKYVLTRARQNSTGPTATRCATFDDLRKVKAGDGPDIVL
jgi:hypothetical protein